MEARMEPRYNYWEPQQPSEQPVSLENGPGLLGMLGHSFSKLAGVASYAVGKTAQKVSDAATRVTNSIKAFQHTIGFAMKSILAVELYKGSICEAGKNVTAHLKSVDGFIDATRLPGDFNYFISGKYQEDAEQGDEIRVAAKASFLLSSVAGTADWLRACGVFSLAKASAALGKVPVFGMLNQMALGTFSLGVSVIALALTTVSAATKIAEGKNVRRAWVELVDGIGCVAFKTFCLVGFVNPYAFVTLGLVSAGMSLCSFFHQEYYPTELAKAV